MLKFELPGNVTSTVEFYELELIKYYELAEWSGPVTGVGDFRRRNASSICLFYSTTLHLLHPAVTNEDSEVSHYVAR